MIRPRWRIKTQYINTFFNAGLKPSVFSDLDLYILTKSRLSFFDTCWSLDLAKISRFQFPKTSIKAFLENEFYRGVYENLLVVLHSHEVLDYHKTVYYVVRLYEKKKVNYCQDGTNTHMYTQNSFFFFFDFSFHSSENTKPLHKSLPFYYYYWNQVGSFPLCTHTFT